MVPLDPERVVEWARSQRLIKRGAESEIRLASFMGLPAILKLRVKKPYMHPALAERLVRIRTRREAKVMAEARSAGVSAPLLYAVFPSAGLIVMEYVEGPLLKDYIGREGWLELFAAAGEELGKLHRAGIVHGDPTTSNYIVRGGSVVLIDYGLASFTEDLEERAVDLHLFRRAVEATHASVASEAYKAFLEGYRSVMGGEAERVEKRAREIALRGRYVEARRSVWAHVGGDSDEDQ
jgi:TP53 regulating kinase-like protein